MVLQQAHAVKMTSQFVGMRIDLGILQLQLSRKVRKAHHIAVLI